MLPSREMLRIYNQSMPRLLTDMEFFTDRLGLSRESGVLLANVNDALGGFAVVEEDALLMLCVKPEFRGKGVGSRLLKEAEELIRSKGFTRAVLGHSAKRYLCQGVPCIFGSEAVRFFEKRGYAADWTSTDLSVWLPNFSVEELYIPPLPKSVNLRAAEPADRPAILYAVEQVKPAWTRFFENSKDPVCVAEEAGEIIGFVSLEGKIPFARNFAADVGGIGCLGVIPSCRCRGVGRRLAAFATDEIKRMGFGVCYAGYTYLEDWYLSVGYDVVGRFWMGEKELI